jgi:tRNA threonylcarbamoyladenosine biosynthesis protein TsaE
MEEIGMREYLEGPGVAVVEWAERLGSLVPPERIEVWIEIVSESERRLDVRAFGRRAEARLAAFKR